MEDGSRSDNDAVYIWKVQGKADLYKIGVTSQRLGETRIEQVSGASGFAVEWIRIFEVESGTAAKVEAEMLACGGLVDFDEPFDGSTEFRRMDDAELLAAIRVAEAA
jgi:hypothetical protein